MTKFYVYAVATGEILRTGNCVISDISLQAGTGEIAVSGGANDAEHYHDLVGDVRADKVAIPYTTNKLTFTANGTDAVDITGLPDDTVLNFMEETESASGGAVSFSINAPGSYELLLTHPLYLDTTFEVTGL